MAALIVRRAPRRIALASTSAAGPPTNVSRKEAARRAPHGVRFQSCADEWEQSLERRDVLCAETLYCITNQAHCLRDTVTIVQR